MSKLEKADLLEMASNHIQQIHGQMKMSHLQPSSTEAGDETLQHVMYGQVEPRLPMHQANDTSNTQVLERPTYVGGVETVTMSKCTDVDGRQSLHGQLDSKDSGLQRSTSVQEAQGACPSLVAATGDCWDSRITFNGLGGDDVCTENLSTHSGKGFAVGQNDVSGRTHNLTTDTKIKPLEINNTDKTKGNELASGQTLPSYYGRVFSPYSTGFNDCIEEIINFMEIHGEIDKDTSADVNNRILEHLANFASSRDVVEKCNDRTSVMHNPASGANTASYDECKHVKSLESKAIDKSSFKSASTEGQINQIPRNECLQKHARMTEHMTPEPWPTHDQDLDEGILVTTGSVKESLRANADSLRYRNVGSDKEVTEEKMPSSSDLTSMNVPIDQQPLRKRLAARFGQPGQNLLKTDSVKETLSIHGSTDMPGTITSLNTLGGDFNEDDDWYKEFTEKNKSIDNMVERTMQFLSATVPIYHEQGSTNPVATRAGDSNTDVDLAGSHKHQLSQTQTLSVVNRRASNGTSDKAQTFVALKPPQAASARQQKKTTKRRGGVNKDNETPLRADRQQDSAGFGPAYSMFSCNSSMWRPW